MEKVFFRWISFPFLMRYCRQSHRTNQWNRQVWRCRLCILDWGLVTNLDPSFRVADSQILGPEIGETNWIHWIPMDILWMLHEVAYIEHIAHLVSGASNSGMNSKKDHLILEIPRNSLIGLCN